MKYRNAMIAFYNKYIGVFRTKKTKKYIALLTQEGTNAPVATVLENTLGGTVVWSYQGSGAYQAYLAGGFQDENKIAIFTGSMSSDFQVGDFFFAEYLTLNNYQTPFTVLGNEFKAIIEIRIYP